MLIDFDNHLGEGRPIVRPCKYCMGKIKEQGLSFGTCWLPNHAIKKMERLIVVE